MRRYIRIYSEARYHTRDSVPLHLLLARQKPKNPEQSSVTPLLATKPGIPSPSP